MRLIVVRHAHADPGDPDELRPLSARGREEAQALAARLAAETPHLVLSSPLLRARETASAIARAAGVELRVDDRLGPGATAEAVVAAAGSVDGVVIAVGHQPDCSILVETLSGRSVDFPPAGHAVVDV